MGFRSQAVQLNVPGSVAAGTAIEIGALQLSGAVLVVNGTFSQTLQVQGSVDDGATFSSWITLTGALVGNITSPGGVFLLGGDATHIRMNVSVHTSGLAIATLMFPPQAARADRRIVP